MMTWDDGMSVADDRMDEDHKGLIALINQLDDAIRGDDRCGVVPAVVEKLVVYAGSPLGEQEAVMVESAYPGLEDHRSEHAAFAAHVGEMQRTLAAGTEIANDAVMNFLIDWLRHHVLKRDKDFAAYRSGRTATAAVA
jgi:hemerythrin-like metal-binding protein